VLHCQVLNNELVFGVTITGLPSTHMIIPNYIISFDLYKEMIAYTG